MLMMKYEIPQKLVVNRIRPLHNHNKEMFDFGMNMSYQTQLFNLVVSIQVVSTFI